jgi:hypothetical protein
MTTISIIGSGNMATNRSELAGAKDERLRHEQPKANPSEGGAGESR